MLKVRKATLLLAVCLVVSLMLNLYAYQYIRSIEEGNAVPSPQKYISLHSQNITAFEKKCAVDVSGMEEDGEWNDTNETVNPDINISLRFKHDTENLYGFVKTDYFGYQNCSLTLYFRSKDTVLALIIDGSNPAPRDGLAPECGNLESSTWKSVYNNSGHHWEERSHFSFEAMIRPAEPSCGFEFVIPLSAVSPSAAYTDMSFACSFFEKDSNIMYQWGNPDDFSTYNALLFE